MLRRSNKLYNKVKELLISDQIYRNSDKKLIWKIWEIEGYVWCGTINFERFLSGRCTTPETITRCRRKVQQDFPNLQATEQVRRLRKEKQKTKGNFVYQEVIDPITKKVISYIKVPADTAAAVS